MGNFWKFQFPAIAWTVLIFVLSSIPDLSGPDLGFGWQDKVKHFGFYGIYGILLVRAFYFQGWSLSLQKHAFRASVIFGVLYAISDEIHQYFVPGRQMDAMDVLADALGIAVLGLLYWKIVLRSPHLSRN